MDGSSDQGMRAMEIAGQAPLLDGGQHLSVRDLSVRERPVRSVNGFLGFLIITVAIGMIVVGSMDKDGHGDDLNVQGIMFVVVGSLVLAIIGGSFRIVNPNESYVVTFLGDYRGVLRAPGFRLIIPFQKTQMVSMRLQNFESPMVEKMTPKCQESCQNHVFFQNNLSKFEIPKISF